MKNDTNWYVEKTPLRSANLWVLCCSVCSSLLNRPIVWIFLNFSRQSSVAAEDSQLQPSGGFCNFVNFLIRAYSWNINTQPKAASILKIFDRNPETNDPYLSPCYFSLVIQLFYWRKTFKCCSIFVVTKAENYQFQQILQIYSAV